MGQRPDLYIGLVCAAGTDLTEVKNQFEAQVSVLKYKKTDIKVSSMISEIVSADPVLDEYERIRNLMHYGDRIRKSTKDHDGVASLIVSGIRNVRGESDVPSSTLYLIDSLKIQRKLMFWIGFMGVIIIRFQYLFRKRSGLKI